MRTAGADEVALFTSSWKDRPSPEVGRGPGGGTDGRSEAAGPPAHHGVESAGLAAHRVARRPSSTSCTPRRRSPSPAGRRPWSSPFTTSTSCGTRSGWRPRCAATFRTWSVHTRQRAPAIVVSSAYTAADVHHTLERAGRTHPPVPSRVRRRGPTRCATGAVTERARAHPVPGHARSTQEHRRPAGGLPATSGAGARGSATGARRGRAGERRGLAVRSRRPGISAAMSS